MKKMKIKSLMILILVICTILIGCTSGVVEEAGGSTVGDELIVHYMDVGQGDSILIQFPEGKVALIDGGSRDFGEKVVRYIKNLGVEKIDYIIATHPHEDHIGGLPEIIRNFQVEKVYMPDRTTNTKIFEELLNEIEKKGLKINIAEGFQTIIEEDDLEFTILGPVKNGYSNTNDYSIVTKIEYMDSSFIFTGDIEEEAEKDLLEAGFDIKSNVLKVAHHGSNTSSTVEFLERVSPDYSVISLGKDNLYGHPHKEVLERLNAIGTKILRTDELGDIVIKSDGKNIIVENDGYIEKTGEIQTKKIFYIGNKNTKVLHSKDCKSLPKEKNQVIFYSLEEGIDAGFTPHSQCIK